MKIISANLLIALALSLGGCTDVVGATGDEGDTTGSSTGSSTAAPQFSGGPCSSDAETEECLDNETLGAMTCQYDASHQLVWSSCKPQQCVEGQTKQSDIGVTCLCQSGFSGKPGDHVYFCHSTSSTSTPLLFSFDGRSAALTTAPGSFNVNPTMSVTTDWPTAMTPWLALDRNHNGVIDDGGELFGSATSLSNNTFAKNGFAALSELDQNHDGRIDANDPAFNALKVWSDVNQDRKTQPGELRSLTEMGIQSIDLSFKNNTHCDDRGNCEIEASTFTFSDVMGGSHIGRIADVHLKHH